MSNPNVVPVTQQEAVQTNITYSAKIGKQVMKSQLQQRLKKAEDDKIVADACLQVTQTKFLTLTNEELKKKAKLSIMQDGDITRFRKLYERFSLCVGDDSCEVTWKNNVDLIKNIDCHELHSALGINHAMASQITKAKKLILDEGQTEVVVELAIPDLDASDGYTNQWLQYEETISLSNESIELFKETLKCKKERDVASEKLRNIRSQLDNIDQVAEEMEAKLLVNELTKSAEGQAVLAVTSEMVSQMLGETPPMLDLKGEE